MRFEPFTYMAWAKEHYFDAGISLVPSGMPPPSPKELPLPADLELRAEFHEEDGLRDALAEAHRCPPERLLPVQGSTQGDALVFQLFLDPGDEVLIEEPAYGLFRSLASLRGAHVKPWPRRPERGFALDPEELDRLLSPRTKLAVLTSVHNPSGHEAPPQVLADIAERCEAKGVPLLVSEVYLDFVAGTDLPPGRSGHRPYAHEVHPWILAANSMTKVYGLGSLRIGWLVGPEDWIKELGRLREILAPNLPAVPQRIAWAALARRKALLQRARRSAARGRAILADFLQGERGFHAEQLGAGITAFVAVDGIEDTQAFRDFLRERFDVGVVPGEFFGLPGRLRVGYGMDPKDLTRGLERLAEGRRAWLGRGGRAGPSSSRARSSAG